MNLLKEFTHQDQCSYLKDKKQTTHYKVIHDCSVQHCESLIERGYRRFGKMYFRPVCEACDECKTIKIDVDNFEFSKSQRRVLRKAEHIQSVIAQPTLTQEHLDLFKKYHQHMEGKKGWEYNPTSPESYYGSFVNGYNDFGFEVLYFDQDKLIGVDLIDILDNGISSIYFYYDPDYAHLALGKLSLLKQIKFAKANNKKWIYLGYYVKDCPSLSYKADYKPYKTLRGRPNTSEGYIYTSE